MNENQCPIGRISVKSSLGVKKLHMMIPSAFDSIHVTRRRKLVSPTAPLPILRSSSRHENDRKTSANRIGPLQKMYGSGESTSHAFPPTLLRIASAPPRTSFNKLRICLRLAKSDLSNQLLSFDPASPSAQFTVNNSSKTSSANSFHQVFSPEVTQQEICSNCLPELLHTVFSGSDASLLYFGGASRLKDELLYSSRPNNYGIFVAALAWTFKLINEFRERKPQFRYSVRISALHYSQKTDGLIDLFEQFNEKPGKPIIVVEDPALGVRVENQTEIRVDSVHKAMFYLDRLIDHRTIEDEESQRGSHVFFYILVYRYKVEGNQVAGGKSRFCLMDLGLGEKHSRNGHITLSAIGNILLAIFQGQKHLPSRQSVFCQLLRESIGNSRNKSSVLLSTLPSNEEDHIIQLASKLHKATRISTRRGKSGSDHSSVASDEKPVRRRGVIDSEQSSSEQSCAETVIFLGPSLKTKEPSPPDPTRTLRKTSEPVAIDFPRCHSAPRTPIHGPAPQPIAIDFPPFYKTASHSLPRNCTFAPPSPLRRTTHDDKFFVISNPMAHESPPPQPPMPMPKAKPSDVDPKKNQMIVNWLLHQEASNGSPRRFQGQEEYGHDVGGIGVPLVEKKPSYFGAKFARLATKMDSAIQCNEEDIDSEMLNVWNAARFLDDIVEDEEESLRTSSLMSSTANREALAEKSFDINILSMNVDQISLHGDDDDGDSVEMNDDDLEKAMAASISSIKSHEILSRLNSEAAETTTETTETHEPTEMDLYRRASHLEAYACERLRELEHEEEQKKRDKKRLAALSKAKLKQLCCQQTPSATSLEGSSSIVDGNLLIFQNSEDEISAATTSVSAGCSPLMPRPMARFLGGKERSAAVDNNNSMTAMTSTQEVKKSPGSPTLKARIKAMWGGGDSGRKPLEVKTPKVPAPKDKWKVKQLNCCQNPSMASSGTSSIPDASNQTEERVGSIPDLPPEVAHQITQQLANYNLKAKSLRQVVSSDSISSTPLHAKISASCQPSPVRSAVLQQTLSVQNIPLESRHHRKSSTSAIPKATTRRKDSVESIRREKKNSSSRVRSKERRNSLESSNATTIPSPYSKVTNAKTVDHGAYSSGHGSDETGSVVHCRPTSSLNANGGIISGSTSRARNRESFSASSGYESADYGRYKTKSNFIDAKTGKLPLLNAKSSKTSSSQQSPSITTQMQSAIDHLYARRAYLQVELSAAKRRISSHDDSSSARLDDRYTDLNPETVLETLSQETRILEKRIAACQSHVMLVTSFL